MNNVFLNTSCDFPYWCDDRDLNQDGTVDDLDEAVFNLNYGLVEQTPPNPNPMTWEIKPNLTGTTTVTMKATRAVDNSGYPVQYYFERTNATGAPDGTVRTWSSDPNWIDPVTAGGTYGYRVKARDVKSNPAMNAETTWSVIAYATSSGGGGTSDTTAPVNLRWTTNPYATSSTAISMTVAADDPGTPLQYQFERTATGKATYTTVWLSSATYKDTGLDPNTTYSYRFRARDKYGNTSGWSTSKTASTGSTPLSPSPLPWVILPVETVNGSSHTHSMQCGTATGGVAPITYKFFCLDYSGVSSGWQTSTTYSVNVGGTHYYRWYAQAKDATGKTVSTSTVWVIR
jgi:hypothetical protein